MAALLGRSRKPARGEGRPRCGDDAEARGLVERATAAAPADGERSRALREEFDRLAATLARPR